MAKCIVIRRIETSNKRYNLKLLYGKHVPNIGAIFHECLQKFVHKSGDLVMLRIFGAFFEQHTQRYAFAVYKTNACMNNTVAFIDGTVVGVVRHGGPYVMQLVL